jgi:hypothetical protein
MSEPTSQPLLPAAARSASPLGLSSRSGPPLGLIFGGIGVLAALAVGLLRLDRLGVPLCYVKAFTGLPCPSCGSTRALARLFDLDVAGAFAMNPLATLAVFALAAWALADLALLTRGRALGVRVERRAASVLRVAALAAVLANWLFLLYAGR